MLKIENKITISLICIFLVGVILRLMHFGYYPLWSDELAVLSHGREDLKYLIYYTFNQSYHHPFYYFILKAWINIIPIFGEWIRGINLIFSTGLVVLPLFFIKEMNKKIVFFLFLALSAHFVLWANTLTNYMSSIFFLALYLFSYIKFYQDENSRNLKLLLISSFLGIYFSFFSSIHILFLGTLLLFPLYKKKSLYFTQYFIFSSLNSLLYFIYFVNSGLFSFLKNPSGTSFWKEEINSLSEILKVIDYYFFDLSLFLLGFVAFVIVAYKSKKDFLPLSFLGSSFLFSILKIGKSFFYHSVIIERYFLYDYLVFSFGLILFLPKKIRKAHKVLIIVLLFCMSLNYLQEKLIIKFHDFESPLTYFVKNSQKAEKLGYMGYNYRHLEFYFEKYKVENRYVVVIENNKCDSISLIEDNLLEFLKKDKFLLLRNPDPCTEGVEKLIEEGKLEIKERFEYVGVKLLEFQ